MLCSCFSRILPFKGLVLPIFHKHSARTYCSEQEIPQTRSSSNVSLPDKQSQSIDTHLGQKDIQREILFEAIAQFNQKQDPHGLKVRLYS